MALLRSWVQTGGHPGDSQKHVWAESVPGFRKRSRVRNNTQDRRAGGIFRLSWKLLICFPLEEENLDCDDHAGPALEAA